MALTEGQIAAAEAMLALMAEQMSALMIIRDDAQTLIRQNARVPDAAATAWLSASKSEAATAAQVLVDALA